MYTDSEKKRVANINRMILEMAGGNFSYIIERSDHNDDLETLVVLLNMMAEEMRETFNHYAFINPHETYHHSAQMTFLLNEKFLITGFSPSVNHVLLLEDKELLGKSLEDILSQDSFKEWEKEKQQLINDPVYNKSIKLSFKTNNSLNVPVFCSISGLVIQEDKSVKYMVTAFLTIIQSRESEKKLHESLQNFEKKPKFKKNAGKVAALRRTSDIDNIRDVYDHILNTLDEPLLNLKDLAHKFGTNEFKLKIGFKQLYNTTVFRFQKEERLKRAHYMIQNLDQPLKAIAPIFGFPNYAHFSRIFKERFGYTPKSLKNKSFNRK